MLQIKRRKNGDAEQGTDTIFTPRPENRNSMLEIGENRERKRGLAYVICVAPQRMANFQSGYAILRTDRSCTFNGKNLVINRLIEPHIRAKSTQSTPKVCIPDEVSISRVLCVLPPSRSLGFFSDNLPPQPTTIMSTLAYG